MTSSKRPRKRRRHNPKPRGDKRERTRARLLDAAAEVIAERGLERASLEEIAARAGMTRGAFYGNFRDKHDLFLAVAEQYWTPVLPPAPGEPATFRDRMGSLGRAVAAAAAAHTPAAVGATSFVLYALQHEEMRSLIARKNAELY